MSLTLLLLTACTTSEPGSVVPVSLQATLTDNTTRADSDKLRDEGRKPAQVLVFLGIERGMTVVDLIAAGGYYTEVLSIAVGPEGQVYAQNPQFVLEFRDGANDKALTARLADDRLENVIRKDGDIDEMGLAANSVDAAITALNFHDLYNNGGADLAIGQMKVVYDLLKPGGVLGIIDHHGNEEADNKALHRIYEPLVQAAVKEAGFVVEGSSGLLRNHSDTHEQSVFAEGVRGNTDRFLLKLRKPES